MNVTVRFFIFDLPPDFANAEFELGDGATVNDVLDRCLDLFEQRQVSMKESELRTATIVVGAKWLNPGDTVSDGDIINIIRPMDGG